MICHVDGRINAVEDHEVPFDPIAKGEVFDIDVSRTCGWFLRVAHSGTSVIVFIEESGGFLWYVEIPEYAANI